MGAIWWTTTIGLIICLGLIGGAFIHFLKRGLNPEESRYVDPVKSNEKTGNDDEEG